MRPQFYVPLRSEDDWRELLAKPGHWKPGRSAQAVASSWLNADGLPPRVADAFAQADSADIHEVQPLLALPEHQVPLPPLQARPSQTDLFVLGRADDGLVTIAVEAKVDEPFGPTVADWDGSEPSPGKTERLAFLRDLLQTDEGRVRELRYQLLHRTGSALIEAKRFTARHAVMLVQSFDPGSTGFNDFREFAGVLGVPDAQIGSIRSAGTRDGIELHLGWVNEA